MNTASGPHSTGVVAEIGCSEQTPCAVCLDISLGTYSEGDDCEGYFRPYDVRKRIEHARRIGIAEELERIANAVEGNDIEVPEFDSMYDAAQWIYDQAHEFLEGRL